MIGRCLPGSKRHGADIRSVVSRAFEQGVGRRVARPNPLDHVCNDIILAKFCPVRTPSRKQFKLPLKHRLFLLGPVGALAQDMFPVAGPLDKLDAQTIADGLPAAAVMELGFALLQQAAGRALRPSSNAAMSSHE